MADLSALKPGIKGEASFCVTEANTAIAVGSGTVPVFASPMMVALMEAACVDCVERLLPPGHLSLGTELNILHFAPTPVGLTVVATAELVSVVGRKLQFRLEARDEREVIGTGLHSRVIVDAARFNARLAAKISPA